MKTTALFLFTCLMAACNQPKQQTIEEQSLEESTAQAVQAEMVVNEDTTVYEMPYNTAYLIGANEYLRENNRYKDWDKNNTQRLVVRAIIEKDSTASNIVIVTKDVEYPELKAEAIRLIQDAKIAPALNENGDVVRSKWVNVIFFPPK